MSDMPDLVESPSPQNSSEPPPSTSETPSSGLSPLAPSTSSPAEAMDQRVVTALTQQLSELRNALAGLSMAANNLTILETDRRSEHARQIESLNQLRSDLSHQMAAFQQPLQNAINSLATSQQLLHESNTTLSRHVEATVATLRAEATKVLGELQAASATAQQQLAKTAEASIAQLRTRKDPPAGASSATSWPVIAILVLLATALGSALGTYQVRKSLDAFTATLSAPSKR